MKRSMVALLLLIALSLSGCKGQKAASSANPVERFESDAKQETSTVVPNQSVDEESQPIEQQKPAEEEKPTAPAEEQKSAEEEKPTEPVKEQKPEEEQKPAEEQKSEEPPAEEQKDDPEIVKFWETVPEMSIDEAKAIVKAKFERIKSEEKLGTLTDEERMAFYVLNCNYYTEKLKQDDVEKKYFHTKDDQILLIVQMNETFDGNTEEYFFEHTWENEEFAQEKFKKRRTRYQLDPNGMDKTFLLDLYYCVAPYDLGVQAPFRLEHLPQGIYIYVDPIEENQKVNIDDPMPKLYRNILKHYLSLKSVAFIEGPAYWESDFAIV